MDLPYSINKITLYRYSEEYLEFCTDLLNSKYEYPEGYLKRVINMPKTNTFIVFVDQEPVGFISYRYMNISHLVIKTKYSIASNMLMYTLPNCNMRIAPVGDNYLQYRSMLDIASVKKYRKKMIKYVIVNNPKKRIEYMLDYIGRKCLWER